MRNFSVAAVSAVLLFGAASASACTYDQSVDASKPMILAQSGSGGGGGGGIDTGSKAGVSGPNSSATSSSSGTSSTGVDINKPSVTTPGGADNTTSTGTTTGSGNTMSGTEKR